MFEFVVYSKVSQHETKEWQLQVQQPVNGLNIYRNYFGTYHYQNPHLETYYWILKNHRIKTV